MLKKLVVCTIGLCSLSANADTIDSAFKLCYALDSTGVLSQECEVDGGSSTVKATLDMSSKEARKLCAGTIELAKQNDIVFDDGWKLKIYSPYSNGNSIAMCRLD
ncbi:hypothetical protein [Aeromonas sobria]|uniref:hypothetical protein n=1 Tax=Aeromonas sobria TaxID=646 RepID=UPI00111850A1|nr:hypothetical protein [Aeromonas sobria]